MFQNFIVFFDFDSRFPLNCHFFNNTCRTRERKILFQRNFQFLRISSSSPKFSQFDRIDDTQITQSMADNDTCRRSTMARSRSD